MSTVMHWDGTAEDATRVIDWVLAQGGTARYHDRPWHDDDPVTGAFILIDLANGRNLIVQPGDNVWFFPHDQPRYRTGDLIPDDQPSSEPGDRLAYLFPTPAETAADESEPSPPIDTSTHRLLATTDAQVWAQEWCRIARGILQADLDHPDDHRPSHLIDEGWMIGWFANAIETGRSFGRTELRDRAGQIDVDLLCDYLVAKQHAQHAVNHRTLVGIVGTVMTDTLLIVSGALNVDDYRPDDVPSGGGG